MKWWSWIWIAVMAWLTAGGAVDDHESRRPVASNVLSVAAGCTCIVLVVAFSVNEVAATLGRWLIVLAVLAGARIVGDAVRDMRRLEPFSELTARENRAIRVLGVLVVMAVFGTAVAVGLFTGARAG
jgi:hypothetical protein